MTHAIDGRRWGVLLATAMLLALLVPGEAGAHEHPGTVLILEDTVTDGVDSLEADSAEALGFDVELVDDATWGAMDASDFAQYRAVVLGDPTCSTDESVLAPAADNAETWGAAVTGNVIVLGTDPTYHSPYGPGGDQGGDAITEDGIAFATGDPDNTGAYVTTSCYYGTVDAETPVPALDGLGTFTTTKVSGCLDDIAVVAQHEELPGYTEPNLGDWGCSVHNAFDNWPLGFEVVGLAREGEAYTAPDGQTGTPYVLARGVTVISDITLSPETATVGQDRDHTLTATVEEDGEPAGDVEVTFDVIDGPHAGAGGTATTGGDGEATFSYTGTDLGQDTIEATFVDADERTQRSNRVTAAWEEFVCPEWPDVHEDNEHFDDICALTIDRILWGYPDGTFGPAAPVTRGQVASVVARTAGIEGISPDTPTFSDTDGSAHEPDIEALTEQGVIEGFPDGTFRPNRAVRRDQAASLIGRWLGVEQIDDGRFDDVPSDLVHAGYINALDEAGVIEGKTATTFEPGNDIRRDQFAAMVNRAR